MIRKNILAAFACLGIAGFTILHTTIAGTEPNSGPKGKEPAKAPGWSRMESTVSSDLRGIWGTSSTNIYAVGYDHSKAGGVILHFDGERWSRIEGGADNYLHAIWGTDKNNIYAVGYRPYDVTFIRFDGSGWQRVIPQRRVIFLHGIGGTSSSDFHAIGYTQGSGGFIIKGGKRFDPARLPEIKPKHTILRGIWCAQKEAFVVGSGGVILHYNGTAWKQMKSPTRRTLQGIWGANRRNIFAVGQEGTILRFNGRSWRSKKSKTTAFLCAIWGRNAKDIFAVGQGGTIIHFNGSKWETMPSGSTSFLQSVWGDADSGDVFAVGTEGTILHYNPRKPVRITAPEEKRSPNEVILFRDAVVPPKGKEGITETAEVDFPKGEWSKIDLFVELVAVNDAWDRIFTMSVSHPDGDVEIDRSMTDWGYSYAYTRDVTPYGVLLKGRREVMAKIKGLPCGWRLNARLIFHPGKPPERPSRIIPLWNFFSMEKNPQAKPRVDTSTINKKIRISKDYSRGEIVLFATGHSPKGRGAEEFGPRRKIHIKYDGRLVETVSPWRDDPTDAHGTRTPRSGWMPKDKVNHFVIKLPESPLKKGKHTVTVEIPGIKSYWVVSAALVLYEKK